MAALAAVALALSGCLSAVRESKLDEYQKQAESLNQELIGVIPDELGAHLKADGWSEKRVRVTGDRTVDGCRKDDWYAEIAWYATVAGKAEALDITIVSPVTVRGDH